jgi:hypothetical protein
MRPKPKEDKDEVKKNEEPIEVKEDINEPNWSYKNIFNEVVYC